MQRSWDVYLRLKRLLDAQDVASFRQSDSFVCCEVLLVLIQMTAASSAIAAAPVPAQGGSNSFSPLWIGFIAVCILAVVAGFVAYYRKRP